MYPSSSPIAKTLLPLVATEQKMADQLSRRLRAAAEKMQRTGLEYKDLIAKNSSPEPEDIFPQQSCNTRERKVVEFVKTVCTRIGPGNSVVIKEILVRRAPLNDSLG